MALTMVQTQLLSLLVTLVLTYYLYPEYILIVTPLYIAITLYFSTNANILEMFGMIPVSTKSVTDIIILYKQYIMIGLAAISAYLLYTTMNSKKVYKNMRDMSDFTTPNVSEEYKAQNRRRDDEFSFENSF